jgi:hypothetical protein
MIIFTNRRPVHNNATRVGTVRQTGDTYLANVSFERDGQPDFDAGTIEFQEQADAVAFAKGVDLGSDGAA